MFVFECVFFVGVAAAVIVVLCVRLKIHNKWNIGRPYVYSAYFQSDEVHQIAKHNIVISMLIDFHFSFDVCERC